MINVEDLIESKKALLVNALDSLDSLVFNKLASLFTETLQYFGVEMVEVQQKVPIYQPNYLAVSRIIASPTLRFPSMLIQP